MKEKKKISEILKTYTHDIFNNNVYNKLNINSFIC